MSNTELDRSLTSWLAAVEPRQAPPEVLAGTFTVTRATTQRRPLLARMSAAIADARILPRVDSSPALLMALLALLIVLVIGALAAGGALQPRRGGWRALDPSQIDGGFTWVNQVAAGGPGLVAVGASVSPVATTCGREVRGRVWTSADGDKWNDQSVNEFADARIERVVAAGGRVYALGVVNAACDDDGLPSYATWSSGDGATWQALADSSALAGSWVSAMFEVEGEPLAIGTYQEADPPDGSGLMETRVWSASDSGWEEIATLDDRWVSWAAAIGSTVLAVTSDTEGNSGLTRSGDGGRTWSPVTVDVDEFGPLAAVDGGFVITGGRGDRGSQLAPVVLSSADGVSWAEGQSPPEALVEMWGVGGQLIAATMPTPSGSQECAESTSVPPATPYMSLEPGETARSEPGQPAPTGSFCIRLREPAADTWLSADGLTWQGGKQLPARGNQLPVITVPIPGSSYSVAGTKDLLVVTNPTFGRSLWSSSLADLAAED